jgi:16S rRNA (guanine527-N7)-methyltransferase
VERAIYGTGKGAGSLGTESVSDPSENIQGLVRFAELLRSSPHNLLSPKGLEELEERHFPEALEFARMLPVGPRLLDVGSGGGLPGIVVAMARPDLDVHLLEATGKKATFLRDAADSLGLDVTVHHGRAEECAVGDLSAGFDLVTARAVAPLDRLVPWTAPYLKSGGQIHAIKGERWAEELDAARSVIQRHGLRVLRTPEPTRSGAPRVVVLESRTA